MKKMQKQMLLSALDNLGQILPDDSQPTRFFMQRVHGLHKRGYIEWFKRKPFLSAKGMVYVYGQFKRKRKKAKVDY